MGDDPPQSRSSITAIMFMSMLVLFIWYEAHLLPEIAAPSASGSTKVAKWNASSVGCPTLPSENDIVPKTAVVHMGIHKTGSSLIQRQSQKFAHLLKLDGYEIPWHLQFIILP